MPLQKQDHATISNIFNISINIICSAYFEIVLPLLWNFSCISAFSWPVHAIWRKIVSRSSAVTYLVSQSPHHHQSWCNKSQKTKRSMPTADRIVWDVLIVRHLKSKTSGALNRNNEGKVNSIYWLREILREYNWGVTTNYLSIYTLVHVVTTRLACDAQPGISQLY